MSLTDPSERKLLKTVLEPLLADFQYWFLRSRTLLESEKMTFLAPEEQAKLLTRIEQAQQEVSAVRVLFQATDGQAGIDMTTLMLWHHLVRECWQVSLQWRSLKNPTQIEDRDD
jgi:predicted flavoprotein YhiN